MKYILKTFDDFRDGGKGLSDISLWYIYHGISRFYTSRTLVSLDVYRKLNGRFSLLELTKSYRDKTLSIMCDESGKIVFIQDDLEVVYYRKMVRVRSFDEPLTTPKLKIDLYSRIRARNDEKRRKLAPLFVEIDGNDFIFRDGKLQKYQKNIGEISDTELIANMWNLLEHDDDADSLFASEYNLIKRGLRDSYSQNAKTSEIFINNYGFE